MRSMRECEVAMKKDARVGTKRRLIAGGPEAHIDGGAHSLVVDKPRAPMHERLDRLDAREVGKRAHVRISAARADIWNPKVREKHSSEHCGWSEKPLLRHQGQQCNDSGSPSLSRSSARPHFLLQPLFFFLRRNVTLVRWCRHCDSETRPR